MKFETWKIRQWGQFFLKSHLNNEYASKLRFSKDTYFLCNKKGEEEEMYENSNANSRKKVTASKVQSQK